MRASRYNGRVPELPDVELYCSALRSRVVGARIEGLRFASPFLLRSVEPSPAAIAGRSVAAVELSGAFASSKAGECIEALAKQASFPKTKKEKTVFSYPIKLP